MEACAECGYSYGALRRGEIAPALEARARDFRVVLLGTDAGRLRARPRPGVWSVLEYACHVRDVLEVQRHRAERAGAEARPDFAPMRREERVTEDGYNDQDPAAVADRLVAGAGALAGLFDGLDDAGWERTGVYHWPTTEVRTVEWIGRHTVHEEVHHLLDVGRLLGERVPTTGAWR
ncbi:MAG TPA: DinB family protein [Acidimicrobiales bacterium]|nr:DinB family protein [Acidimicrobiales bacterium]